MPQLKCFCFDEELQRPMLLLGSAIVNIPLKPVLAAASFLYQQACPTNSRVELEITC
jgi:hypothetical protein